MVGKQFSAKRIEQQQYKKNARRGNECIAEEDNKCFIFPKCFMRKVYRLK